MVTRLTRREVAGLLLGSAFLAACGGAKKATTTSSTGGGSSPITPSPAGSSGSTSTLPTVHLTGATVPVGDQASVADSSRYSQLLSGRWLGAWHDSAGRSGTNDAAISFSPRARTATFTLSATGDLLGAPVEAESYSVDLKGFARSAAHVHIHSPQLGEVVYTPLSGTAFTGVATPPGGTIKSIEASANRVGSRVDVSYTMTPVSGAVVHGTMAFARGGTRAKPAAIGDTTSATPANVQSGEYAAGLLTAAQATRAIGQPCSTPTANGGNVGYAVGVESTNGLCHSVDKKYVVQYTIFLAHSPKLAAKFWKGYLQGLPTVAGPWKSAFFDGVGTLNAFTGKAVVTVQVLNVKAPIDVTLRRRASLEIGRDLVRALDH